MSRELQDWLKAAPFRLKRELVGAVREQADKLAEAIRARAPVRSTRLDRSPPPGALRDSIRVRRTRNELTFHVTAGGSATAQSYNRSTRYRREVVIGSGDTSGIPRGTEAGVVYDYARALEFGTTKMSARPFFYNTAREMEPEIRAAIEQAVADALSK